MTATACGRCQTVLEAGDLRCATCAFPVALERPVEIAESPRAQVLRCGDCGAAVAFVGEARAPRCGFCGQVMAIEQPVDPVEAARVQLAWGVDRAAAEAAMRGWLAGRGWFAPRALSSEAVLESLTPLAWAAWLVSADALVTWTADSDAGAQRSAWAPHAGSASLAFHNIIVPASRGLRHAECRTLIPHYELAQARSIDPAAAPGPMIESFDAQRSAARRHVRDAITAAARVRIQRHIPGRRYRKIRVACLVERQTTERIALPAWILAYRYRGAIYRAIVHGQRPEIVVGTAPVDWRKVGVIVAVAAAIAALIAVFVLVR